MAFVVVQGSANAQPVARFTSNYSVVGYALPGQPFVIQFTDTSRDSGATINYWNWSFGDGNYSSLQNPTHAYNWSRNFTVTLIVGDTNGQYDTKTVVNAVKVGIIVTGNMTWTNSSGSYNTKYITPGVLQGLYTTYTINAWYGKHNMPGVYWFNVTGASLNNVINDAGIWDNATKITFIGGDNFSQTVPWSYIQTNTTSIIAFNCSPDGSFRNIIWDPTFDSQTPDNVTHFGQQWVKDLVEIKIS